MGAKYTDEDYKNAAKIIEKIYGKLPEGAYRCGKCNQPAKAGRWHRNRKICVKCFNAIQKLAKKKK